MQLDRKPLTPSARLLLGASAEQQLAAVAASIRDDARRMAPRDTGRLARSIEAERIVEGGRVQYIVGWTTAAPYGWLVEAGTEDTPPRPHLVPAAVKNGAQAPIEGR